MSREGDAPSHGFRVGLGTLASGALAERLVMQDLTRLDEEELVARWPLWEQVAESVRRALRDPRIEASALEETRAKYLTSGQARRRLRRIRRGWPELQPALWAQSRPVEELRMMLVAAGCPTTPEQIGLSRAQLQRDYSRARHIRTRYTLLDMAAEVGRLDSIVDHLFSPQGSWGRAH